MFYVISDFADHLVGIEASDTTDYQKKVQIQSGGRFFNNTVTDVEPQDVKIYTFDISEQVKSSTDGMVHLEVTEYYKGRRIPFPARVELTERQTMQFLDSKYLMSPYRVEM